MNLNKEMKHRGQCIFVDNCGCILVVNMFNKRAARIPSAAARLWFLDE